MQFVFVASILVALAFVAMRFGADSRERSSNAWFARPSKTRYESGTAFIDLRCGRTYLGGSDAPMSRRC
jgi:hypothetical protein